MQDKNAIFENEDCGQVLDSGQGQTFLTADIDFIEVSECGWWLCIHFVGMEQFTAMPVSMAITFIKGAIYIG